MTSNNQLCGSYSATVAQSDNYNVNIAGDTLTFDVPKLATVGTYSVAVKVSQDDDTTRNTIINLAFVVNPCVVLSFDYVEGAITS